MPRVKALTSDGLVHVIVESPRGATAKFKWDNDADLVSLSRPLPAGLAYPCDWGFVPGTRAADGDPVDAFVLWNGTAYPGVLMACRALGVLRVSQTLRDSGRTERNDRIALVPAKDPDSAHLRSITDLSERKRKELEQFFAAVVAFEPKDVTLEGWAGPEDALALIRGALL